MSTPRFVNLMVAGLVGCLAFHSHLASATLLNGSVLSFTPAPGSPNTSQPTSGNGSWFVIEPAVYDYYVSLTSFNGIMIGSTQPAYGSHPGTPDGTENPSIDQPHDYFGNTGLFGSESAINILSASGNTASLDFSGLVWDWAGVDNIHFYDANFGDNGIATITCGVDCSNGDSYTLDYTGHIRSGDGGLGGELVLLHLEGTISAVPLPAAAYLFGLGLVGLIGTTRRKNVHS
jgi:hypothetical protein